MTSENGCPFASSRPSPSVSSRAVPAGKTQVFPVPHWLLLTQKTTGGELLHVPFVMRPLPSASSFGPLIPVICPAVNPPAPRRTRTFQVPVGIWLPPFGRNGLTSDVRCTASMLLWVSCTAGSAAWRLCAHCPIWIG